jgi:hypothetical protein
MHFSTLRGSVSQRGNLKGIKENWLLNIDVGEEGKG